MKVTNTDLLNNRYKYSIEILEQNIVENHLDEKILLATQKLTPEFCVKHILDLDIESGGEESYIFDVCYILEFQTHITEKELKNLTPFLSSSKLVAPSNIPSVETSG